MEKSDYKKFGVICESYLDIDYFTVLSLTDKEQKWDGIRFYWYFQKEK